MTDEVRFDRFAREWLELGPVEAPSDVIQAAFVEINTTTQERDLRVPWRLPRMTPMLRAVATILVVAVIGGGALLVLRSSPGGEAGAPPTASPSPSPSPSASPSPTPTPMTLAAFTAARNAVCSHAAGALNPLKPRFLGIFNDTLTDAQRTDWIAALEQYSAGNQSMIDALVALPAPAELAADNATALRDLQDEEDQIRVVISALKNRQYEEARVADAATDPMGIRISRWETQHALTNCP